jgi:cob(I)alamin adenosyltransferase
MKGYVHVYTGNGKGKSTAAFGLALRALCAGKKVYIGQFIKGMKYHEVAVQEKYSNICIEQYGENCFIEKTPEAKDFERAKIGLEKINKILKSGEYDLVILDEVTIALYYDMIDVNALIEVIKNRAHHVECVLTGRYAPKALMDFADLVTEMQEIKHYYKDGVISRPGIDH